MVAMEESKEEAFPEARDWGGKGSNALHPAETNSPRMGLFSLGEVDEHPLSPKRLKWYPAGQLDTMAAILVPQYSPCCR